MGKLQYIINNTYHSVVKASPSQLLLGYQQRNHADFPLAEFTKTLTKIDEDLEKKRTETRDAAAQATDIIREYNKKYRDGKCKKPTDYNVGDYVLIRSTQFKPGENSKLAPKYKGPYMVKKVLGNSRYVITDIPGFNITQKPLDTILSSDRMKHWIKT